MIFIRFLKESIKFLLCIYKFNDYKFRKFPDFNINKGKTCLVMGNGPSLKKIIDDYERGEIEIPQDTFCVNLSPLSPSFYKIKPKYLLWSDYIFIQDTPGSTETVRKMYDMMQDQVDWNLTIYLNAPYKKDNDRLIKYSRLTNKNIRFVILNRKYCDDLSSTWRNRLYSSGFFMPTEGTVVNTAIYVAILQGYKEIHLYGSELTMYRNLEVGTDNQLYIVEKHYYDKDHKHPVSLDGGGKAYTHTYFSWMYAMFHSHYLLRQFADYKGVRVINCTPGSMIDVYERKPGC